MICYSHMGQHSGCSNQYVKNIKEANYNQYWDLLRELIGQGYNNLQVMNGQEFEAHRQPTKSEIKFGHGATHYRNFKLADYLKRNGNIKKWFIADDNLRYSTI